MSTFRSSGRIVALDPGDERFYGDRAFEMDPERYQGVVMWATLRELLARDGIELLTVDRVIGRDLRGVPLITLCHSPVSERLLDAGARGAVLHCWESPHVAWRFYAEVGRLARRYASVLLFPGMLDRVKSHAGAEPGFVPLPHRSVVRATPWTDRDFLTAVASHSAVAPGTLGALARSLVGRAFSRRPVAQRLSVRRQLLALRDPSILQELYSERMRAYAHFGSRSDFALYGVGWERPTVPAAARQAYRGIASNKLTTLAGYRFALCFENAAHPGYVTEKLFDAMFAGTVPVYLGAPDIERYVPADLFIDARKYPDYEALEAHLRSITPGRGARYLEAAAHFMASDGFDPFFHRATAAKVRQVVRRTLGTIDHH